MLILCSLRTAFAGGILCQSFPEDPLQSATPLLVTKKNVTLSGPVYFARCVAECCTGEKCNMNLFPILTELSLTEPSSTVEVVVSSTPVSQNTTQPETTEASTKLATSWAS